MTDPYAQPIFRDRPGVILGPYESLLAALVWLNECLSAVNRESSSWRAGIVTLAPAVHPSKREQLTAALLLFGQFDALAGLFLLDSYLASHGVTESRREIFGDIVPFGDGPNSPFAHPLDKGWISHARAQELKPEPSQTRLLTASVARVLQRSGYVVSSEGRQRIRASIERRASLPPNLFKADLSTVELSITATLAMLERAVDTDVALMSADCAAPAWRRTDSVEASARILKIVWDEVTWLPRPKTLREASLMRADDWVVGLRHAIDLWRHKIAVGDLSDWSHVRADIRRHVEHFTKKPWASQVVRLTTYVAVPVAVVETLLGNPGVGLTLGAVGCASQCIADLIERHKSRHWLSVGRDFIVRGGPPNKRTQPTR